MARYNFNFKIKSNTDPTVIHDSIPGHRLAKICGNCKSFLLRDGIAPDHVRGIVKGGYCLMGIKKRTLTDEQLKAYPHTTYLSTCDEHMNKSIRQVIDPVLRWLYKRIDYKTWRYYDD